MSASNGPQTLILHEIYESIQGEGLYTGVPTIFIRLQGCPLRCTWCDSKYTWDFGIPEVVRPDGATYIIPNHG